MAADRQLYIEIVVDDGGAVRKLAAVDAAAAGVGKTSKTTAVGVTGMEESIRRATTQGVVWGNVLTNVVESGIMGLKTGIMSFIGAAAQYDATMTGLATVSKAFKVDTDSAKSAAQELASDGLMTVGEAAMGLKNLLAAGFGLPEAVRLMKGFKDIAAFNRQASLDFGYAVVSATEGIKNQNSILVDNAGLTKNLSVIMREAGLSISDMAKISSDAGIRQKFLAGLLKETSFSSGDAAKMAQQYSGQLAALKTSITVISQEMGRELMPVALKVVAFFREVVPFVRAGVAAFGQLPEPIKTTAVAVAMLTAAAGTGAIALRAMGIPIGDMITKFPTFGASSASLARVLLSPTGLIAALGLLAFAITQVGVSKLEEEAQTWKDAAGLLGRGAKNLQEARDVVASFVAGGGNMDQLRAKYEQTTRTLEAQAQVTKVGKAVTLEMANAAVDGAVSQGKNAMAITTATIALDKHRTISTGATLAEAEMHAKMLKTVGARQQLTVVMEENRKKITDVELANARAIEADKAYNEAIKNKTEALRVDIEAMDRTGLSLKQIAGLNTIAEEHVTRFKKELDESTKSLEKHKKESEALADAAWEMTRKMILGVEGIKDAEGRAVVHTREKWKAMADAQEKTTQDMRKNFRAWMDERLEKSRATFDAELDLWLARTAEKNDIERNLRMTLLNLEKDSLSKRLRLQEEDFAARKAGLDKNSEHYIRNLQLLEITNAATVANIKQEWQKFLAEQEAQAKTWANLWKGLGAEFMNGFGNAISSAIANGTSIKQGLKDFAKSFLIDMGGAIGEYLGGPIGKALGQIGGAIIGKIFDIGGPSKAELEGRRIVEAFEQGLQGSLTAAQKLSLGNESWRMTTVAVTKAYLDAGFTVAQAEAAVKKLWESSKQGAEASRIAILEIQAVMDVAAQKQRELAEAQAAQTKANEALIQPHLDLINGLTAEYNSLWESIKDEAPEEVMGIVETNTRKRMEQIAKEREHAVENLKTLTETLGLGFDDVIKKLDEFISRLGSIPAVRIKTTIAPPTTEVPEEAGEQHQGGAIRYHAGGNILPFLPRAHSGLAVDEVPIVAQTGEFMMSRADVRNAGGMDAVKAHRGAGGGTVIQLTINRPILRDRAGIQELAREVKSALDSDLRGSGRRMGRR